MEILTCFVLMLLRVADNFALLISNGEQLYCARQRRISGETLKMVVGHGYLNTIQNISAQALSYRPKT